MEVTTQNPNKLKKFVDDFNWINNVLHDFAIRTAFIETTEKRCTKNPELKEIPLIMNIYNSMANDAVVKINNVYDTHKDALSIFYILCWIKGNVPLLENQINTLRVKDNDIAVIENKIRKHHELIDKFHKMRKKLITHNDKKIVHTTDIRRRLLNNKNIKTQNDFLRESQEYIKELQGFILNKGDFVNIQNLTVEILMDIKKFLKMPDRIFGKSGNKQEWNNFYDSTKKNALYFFDILQKKK